jgi:carbonic anhydrase
MNIKQIFANNQHWISEKLKIDKDYFKKLSVGQNPEFLYIGCSDSRVTAEELMGVQPGDVFVHRNIGNMVPNTAMQSADMGILNPWLRNIRDVYRLHRQELESIDDSEEKYKRLVELNVQEQCVNVIKTADVQKAFKERQIAVHGWVFDVHTGQLIDLKINFDKILSDIMEIYRII